MNNPFIEWSSSKIHLAKGQLGGFAKLGGIAILAQMVVSGTRFATTVMIGRFCGPEELGVYSLGFSLLVLTAVLQESLITTPYIVLGNRESGPSHREYAGSVLTHYLVLAFFLAFCLALAAVVLPFVDDTTTLHTVIWVLVAIVPFTLLREFARKYCFAHINVRAALAIDLVVAALQIGGLFVLAKSGILTAKTAYVTVGLSCLVAGLAWLLYARKAFAFNVQRIRALAVRHWQFGKWLLGGRVVTVFSQWGSYWLLLILVNTTEIGIFAACMSVVMLSNPFVLGMSSILEPRLARAIADGGCTELERVVRKVSFIMASVFGLFFLTLLFVGDQLIGFIYNNSAYAGYGHMISVLALSVMFSAVGISYGMGLNQLERTDLSFAVKMVELVVVLLAFIPLVTYWGMLAGAYALLLSSIIGCIARCLVFSHVLHRLDRQLVPNSHDELVSE